MQLTCREVFVQGIHGQVTGVAALSSSKYTAWFPRGVAYVTHMGSTGIVHSRYSTCERFPASQSTVPRLLCAPHLQGI